MSSNKLISIQNCRVQDIHGTIIPELNWTMSAGEAWLVIGPNGGGKAEFLKALAKEKQIVPNTDSSSYENVFDGNEKSSTEIVSLERAAKLIEEERDLDESEYLDGIDIGRTGRRFICEVLGGPDAKHRNQPLPPIADRLETLPEVKLCGVEKILDRGLKFMSTGEIRRTLLCRALLSGKKLLILSDPFAGLDAQSRKILLEFFQTIVGKQSRKNGNTSVESSGKTYDDSAVKIILGMERYIEIPQTITNVIEFTRNEVSFCGTKSDYELLLQKREDENKKTAEEKKSQFVAELKTIRNETQILKNQGENNQASEEISGEKTLIQMNHVNVGWDGHNVLQDFNWNVLPNQHWLVRGPNGSGKTTLLELITGDNKQVYCNDIWLFGKKRGTGETIWDIKSKLGIVSYRMHVEYRMIGSTDLESVIISGFHDSIGLYEQKTDIEIATARKWLKLAGFEGRESESFSQLSYGEQRAILIIRAAVKNPRILILDEPCHGLDEQYRQKILALLETIAETGTTTLIHVTHDPTEVLACEKNILELRPGQSPMYAVFKA